jgi:hypothetical protein
MFLEQHGAELLGPVTGRVVLELVGDPLGELAANWNPASA